jgi:hypothetical protein
MERAFFAGLATMSPERPTVRPMCLTKYRTAWLSYGKQKMRVGNAVRCAKLPSRHRWQLLRKPALPNVAPRKSCREAVGQHRTRLCTHHE